ncbi:MAG: Hsp20/alpha crystallin family protein [Mycobacterium sp.]|nr:Hsp20/alpha crystallin family protein [Mycobacterium sp.]
MTNLPTHRHRDPRSWLSELSDAFTGWPWAGPRPIGAENQLIRLEEEVQDGHYVVRAELPGIDPAKDVDITVCGGRLTIKAERTEKTETNGRSEFSYGSFTRTISLPSGANPDDITANYDKGILTVNVAVPEQTTPQVKHIAVQNATA